MSHDMFMGWDFHKMTTRQKISYSLSENELPIKIAEHTIHKFLLFENTIIAFL